MGTAPKRAHDLTVARCASVCVANGALSLLLNNANFRQFSELVPRVRVLLDNFVKSRYTDVLTYLEQSKVGPVEP